MSSAAPGVDELVLTAGAHSSNLAGTTDLACVITGMMLLGERECVRLREHDYEDLAEALEDHIGSYTPLLERLHGIRASGRDLVVLQGRLVQPLWQDTQTPDPTIDLLKSMPRIDRAIAAILADDSYLEPAVDDLLLSGRRLTASADMMAPDFVPPEQINRPAGLDHLLRNPPDDQRRKSGPKDGPTM